MKLTAGLGLQNGKYLINHVGSKCGLGVLLQGTQAAGNRPVILQTLQPALRSNEHFPSIKQRFHQQIERFGRCHHPGIAQLIEYFEEGGWPFAVMEAPTGQTLAGIITSHGPQPEGRAVRYIQQLGSALIAIHQQGVTHRHVTPATLIRPPHSDIIVLTSFGATDPVILEWVGADYSPLAGAYAGPELYHPQLPITPTTDVYAIAGTLYFLVTGQPPIAASLRQQQRVRSPREYVPHLKAELEAAILRGMELNPKVRPQTVAEWLSLLIDAIPVSLPNVAPLPVASHLTPTTKQQSTPPAQPQAERHGTPPTSGTLRQTDHLRQITAQPVKKTVRYSVNPANPSKHFATTLISVSLMAAAIGVGSGLLLRLAATTTGPGRSFFHSEQSFPTLEDWPGQAEPIAPPPSYSEPSDRDPGSTPYRSEEPIPYTPPRNSRSAPVPEPTPEASPAPDALTAPSPEPPTTPVDPAPAAAPILPEAAPAPVELPPPVAPPPPPAAVEREPAPPPPLPSEPAPPADSN